MRRLLLSTVIASVACGGGEASMPTELDARILVGDVEDSDVVLGAIVEGDDLRVYACGGAETFATHTRWFEGPIGTGDDPDAFAIDVDGFTLAGTRTSASLDGTMTEPDGTAHAFVVRPPADGSLAGLYGAQVDGCTTGVVLQDRAGEVDGQGTYCNDAGEFVQVIILRPVELTANGIEVQVERPDGPLNFFVAPQ